MKAQSVKLRAFITLFALYKYSDKNHPMCVSDLKPFLEPYGIDCSSRAYKDTLRVLNDFHVSIGRIGNGKRDYAWLNNLTLSNAQLDTLIRAITTNPYLSEETMEEALASLKPFVTIYQENRIKNRISRSPSLSVDSKLIECIGIINEAIQTNKRVVYVKEYLLYDSVNGQITVKERKQNLFTPKYIYQTKNTFYMIGYDLARKRIKAVDLQEVKDIRLATRKVKREINTTEQSLALVNPEEFLPKTHPQIIYQGPVEFHCKPSFLKELFMKVGNADSKVTHSVKKKYYIYHKENLQIDVEFLHWLVDIPNRGICIAGPDDATAALNTYFEETSKRVLKQKQRCKQNL